MSDMGTGEKTLSQAAKFVAEARSELTVQIEQLRGKLQGISSQWQGQGANSFVSVMQTWDSQQRRVVSALDEFESNLLGTEKDFSSTDESQSQNFKNQQSRLGG